MENQIYEMSDSELEVPTPPNDKSPTLLDFTTEKDRKQQTTLDERLNKQAPSNDKASEMEPIQQPTIQERKPRKKPYEVPAGFEPRRSERQKKPTTNPDFLYSYSAEPEFSELEYALMIQTTLGENNFNDEEPI